MEIMNKRDPKGYDAHLERYTEEYKKSKNLWNSMWQMSQVKSFTNVEFQIILA